MTKRSLLFLSLFLFAGFPSYGQVEISGSVDVAVKMGGEESGYFVNGIHTDFTHFHTRVEEFNLDVFAPLSDNFFIEARTQVKNDAQGKLAPPKLVLANATYSPLDKQYFIQGGKIIMPFGFYPSRQLQIDRTFVDYPMSYSYSIFISRERGWWKGTRGKYVETQVDYGVQNIFYGGYTTGLMYGWENDKSTVRLAMANESITGYDASTNQTLGGIARFTHSPSAYFTFGLSATHGSFMHSTAANDSVFSESDLSEFTQTALGGDFQIGFTFFEIIGEATFSNWQVPGLALTEQTGGEIDRRYLRDNSGDIEKLSLSNLAANIDLKFEPPFFTGGYFAVRYDQMTFFDADSDELGSFMWDYDNTRITGVIGYKLDRNVLFKLSLSEQDDFNGKAYAFKAYLTAAF